MWSKSQPEPFLDKQLCCFRGIACLFTVPPLGVIFKLLFVTQFLTQVWVQVEYYDSKLKSLCMWHKVWFCGLAEVELSHVLSFLPFFSSRESFLNVNFQHLKGGRFSAWKWKCLPHPLPRMITSQQGAWLCLNCASQVFFVYTWTNPSESQGIVRRRHSFLMMPQPLVLVCPWEIWSILF